MSAFDAVTLLSAILVAGLGLAFGFARTLRFFTKGIFGFVISVFLCATLGGMIAGIPAVGRLISRLHASLSDAWSFLGKIHLEKVIYYLLLFIALQILRMIVVRLIGGIFSADNAVMRFLNRILGMVLMTAAVFLLLLLVFGIFRIFEDTSFVQDFIAETEGAFLGKLYEINPVRFVADGKEEALLPLLLL